MTTNIPENHRYLRDAFGSVITDGACICEAVIASLTDAGEEDIYRSALPWHRR